MNILWISYELFNLFILSARTLASDLSLHFAAVADFHNENTQGAVLNVGNDAVIANAIFPELAQPGAFECFADAARILQHSHMLGRAKLACGASGRGRELGARRALQGRRTFLDFCNTMNTCIQKEMVKWLLQFGSIRRLSIGWTTWPPKLAAPRHIIYASWSPMGSMIWKIITWPLRQWNESARVMKKFIPPIK